MSLLENDLVPGPGPEEDSDDMFEAIAPSPRASSSKDGEGEDANGAKGKDGATRTGTTRGDGSSSSGASTGHTTAVTRTRVGARMIASIEGDLIEVPEVAAPLIRILDQFVEDSLPNMQAGIAEFARLAKQHLEVWGLNAPINEAERLNRLAVVPADPMKLHESLDDLAVAARYLSRMRPEEYVDAGSWQLFRNVRKALRSDKIDFLAEVCRDLTEAVEHDPHHLQKDYLPRIEQRYNELVARELERLRFILEVSPESAEAYPIAQALGEIDRAVGSLEDLHGKHPLPTLGAFLDEVHARRKPFIPRLIEHCEAGIERPEFERIVYLLGALDLLDPERPSGEALQPARRKLEELLAGLKQELRDMVAEALSKAEPAPAWRVLKLFESLPETEREAGSEFGKLQSEVQAHYEQQLAALEQAISAALAGNDLEPVDDALRRLEGLLETVPEHSLKPKHGELLRHKQKILEALSREEAIRAAYEGLKAKVDSLCANGEASVAEARGVLEALELDTLVPAEVKQPLRDLAKSRHDLLALLYAALEQESSANVEKKRQAAEALLNEEDRYTLQPLLQKVNEHREELKAIEEQLAQVNGLKQTLQGAEETPGPKQEAERVGASLNELHTSKRFGHPGSVTPRQALGKAVRMAKRIRVDLDVLAAAPGRALDGLGSFSPESVEAAEAPRFAGAQSELQAVQKEAAPTLEYADLLAEQVKRAESAAGSCQELALAWHEIRERMEADLDSKRVRGGHKSEISEVAATAAGSREPFKRLDSYLGAQGRILAWYDTQLESLGEVGQRVDEALVARNRRRKRVRNAAVLTVLVALLVSGGIYGWMLYQEHQRWQHVQDLLAQAEAALDETELEPIDAVLEESHDFLAEGENEAEYGTLFADVLEELEKRRSRFAELDEVMARLREAAEEARARNSGFLAVRDEIVEFRDERALSRHHEELEAMRLDMLLGWVELAAQPGLEPESGLGDAQAALAEVQRRVAEVGGAALNPLVEPVVEALHARIRELRIGALEALAEPGFEAEQPEQVAGVQRRLEQAVAEEEYPEVVAAGESLVEDLQTHWAALRIAALREIAERGLAAEAVHVLEAARAELSDELAAEEDPRVIAAGEDMRAELEEHWVSLRIAALEALATPGFDTQRPVQVTRVQRQVEQSVADEEHGEVVAAGERLVEELQVHWVALRIAELDALANPGLEADRPREAARVLRRLGDAVDAAEHTEVVAHGEELLDELQAHWLALRIADLDALAQPGLETEVPREVLRVRQRVEDAVAGVEHAEVLAHGEDLAERLQARWLELQIAELEGLAQPGIAADELEVAEAVEAEFLTALEAERNAEVVDALEPTREELRERILSLRLGELGEIAEAALLSEDPSVVEAARDTLSAARGDLEEPELVAQLERYVERLEERLQWLLALAALRERMAALLANAAASPDEVVEEHEKIRAELRNVVVPVGEPPPAEMLAVPLADVETREWLLLIADEALESDTQRALAQAVAEIEEALAAERGEIHREALAPYLAQMQGRLAEIQAEEEARERELAELIAQAQELLESEELAPLADWLERARAFHAEAATERADELEPWLDRVERRHALVEEKLERFAALVEQAEAALESEEVAPLAGAHDAFHGYLSDGEPLPSQVEPLHAWRERLAESLFARWEERGLASEDAPEIREVTQRLRELPEELPDSDVLLSRLEPATERLNARAAYFALRENIRTEQTQRLEGTDPLEELAPELEALDGRVATLEDTDTSFDAFGVEPSAHADIHEAQVSLRTREALMLAAVAGLEKETADEVAARAAEVREALNQPDNEVHEPALAPYLALLDRLAELFATAAEGLGLTEASAVRALIEQLEEALASAEVEPLRAPMEVPLDRLRQYAEVLENPDQFAELTLEGPDSVETRQVTVTGTVSGAPLDIVFLYINGHEQRTAVEDGTFEAVVILRTGDNRIVASPVDSPNHPNAEEIRVVGDFASAVVTVMLTWDTATDLDLRVVEPDGTEISWRRRIARGLHGRLDTDERAYGPENYSFTVQPGQQMPQGEYRVYVDYFEGDEPVNWELNIVWFEDTPDEINLELTGHIDPAEDARNVRAYTFHVDEEGRLLEEDDNDNNDGNAENGEAGANGRRD